MTATRIGLGAATLLGGGAAAVLLWRTAVPGDLVVPPLRAEDVFPRAVLRDSADYARVARVLGAGSLLVQLATLAVLARRPPRVPGRGLVQGLLTLAAVLALVWLARLPFALAAQWWRRRHDLSRAGYVEYLLNPWLEVAGSLVVIGLAYAAAVLLARRLGRRWWLAGGPTLAVVGCAAILLQPLVLAPKLDPVADRALAAEVEALAARMGVDVARVEVRRASERTTRANAEVAGVGPTRRVILWDTLLDGRYSRAEIRFVVAHELAHARAHHLWKGLAWFALLAVPCVWVLARLVRVEEPRQAARAALVVVALQLALLPLANGLSRRYETEADWLALRATGEPGAAVATFRRFAETNLAQPDPPRLWHAVFGSHPTGLERAATARAAPRAGS